MGGSLSPTGRPPLPAARAARTYSEVGVWRRELVYPVVAVTVSPSEMATTETAHFPGSRGPEEGNQPVAMAGKVRPGSGDLTPTVHGALRVALPAAVSTRSEAWGPRKPGGVKIPMGQ